MAQPPANLTRGRPGPVHGQARSGAPGTNDFRCRPGTVNCPSSSFPGPGRTPTRNGRAGLCAYTFTDNPLVVDGHPVEWAVFSGDIRHSSKTLDSVVDRVLAATGAPAVNLVGYSQGSGPLPHHYIRELGGDRVVEQLIGTGPRTTGPGRTAQPIALTSTPRCATDTPETPAKRTRLPGNSRSPVPCC